jgi:secretion/DNA translocation related TadE-like protein
VWITGTDRAKYDADAGGISVLMITVLLVTILVSTPLLYFGGAICVQMKLANSADLVALGAAKDFLSDQPNPCQVAKSIAVKNEVGLVNCQVEDLSVLIKVMVPTPNFVQRLGVATLTAQARAGL